MQAKKKKVIINMSKATPHEIALLSKILLQLSANLAPQSKRVLVKKTHRVNLVNTD